MFDDDKLRNINEKEKDLIKAEDDFRKALDDHHKAEKELHIALNKRDTIKYELNKLKEERQAESQRETAKKEEEKRNEYRGKTLQYAIEAKDLEMEKYTRQRQKYLEMTLDQLIELHKRDPCSFFKEMIKYDIIDERNCLDLVQKLIADDDMRGDAEFFFHYFGSVSHDFKIKMIQRFKINDIPKAALDILNNNPELVSKVLEILKKEDDKIRAFGDRAKPSKWSQLQSRLENPDKLISLE